MPEVSEEMLQKATAGLESAKKSIDDGMKQMEQCNKRMEELFNKQSDAEKGRAKDGETIESIKQQLNDLGSRMESIAKAHTANVELVRNQMKLIGQNTDGGTERGAYIYRHPDAKGAIFESKRQAEELGYFLVATMHRDTEFKKRAQQWLSDQRQDLQFIPNIPRSLIQAIGDDFLKTFKSREQALGISTTPGSVLTAPTFANTLIRNVEEHGAFRKNALLWPMGSDTVKIPKRTGGTVVKWEGEATAVTSTDPTFTLLTMTAKKMMEFFQYSSELDEDSIIALADAFMFEIALSFATEEDRIGFNGNGSGGDLSVGGYAGFVGVLNGADVQTVTGLAGADLSSEITLRKLREMTGKNHTWARRGAKWYMSRTVHSDCDGIETSGGGPVVKYREGHSASMLGYPIVDVEAMPASSDIDASTRAFALGDLRKGWILGDRRKPEVKTSEHFAINTDQLSTLATARIALMEADGSAMVVYITGTA